MRWETHQVEALHSRDLCFAERVVRLVVLKRRMVETIKVTSRP